MSTNTHRMHSARRLVTAAAGLALILTAASTRPLHAQGTQDTTVKKSPWDLPPSPTRTPPTQPTGQPTGQATGQVVADSGFIREAASINQAEVRLGTLAEQRSSNTAVKQFAQQMVASHTSMGQQWTSLATQKGLPTSVPLNSTQQQTADQLSKLSGAAFDRAYMNAMVADHEQAAGTLQRIGTYAQTAEVKRLAASGVSATQQHLSLAQQVASQVGAPTAVATKPPVSGGGVGARRPKDAGEASDGRYAKELAYGHIMETRLAEMAQKRAKDKEVKQFANQMADHFDKWRQRWTDLATKHGVASVNPNMGPLHREKLHRLENASSRNFDQVYLDIVVENLGSMLPYLQKEGRAANSADIRNAVNDELPTVRQKLSTAQRLERQVQVTGKAKVKGKSLSDKE
jgi:putative membrane protein